MRIALLHPTYWPEVTRGSERLVHDLATTLAERGHEVTVLTSHRGAAATTFEDGVRVVRSRRLPQPPTFGLNEDYLGNMQNVVLRLLRGDYDVAHAFHLADAWAAVKARRIGGPPVVFSFHGMPTRHHLVARRYRLEMMETVVSRAAVTAVLSEAAADLFRRYLLGDPWILPGGVVWEDFAIDEPREPVPTVLAPAALGDPRKRGALLLAAFSALRRDRPELRLEVVRTRDPFLSPYRLELPDGAAWIEPRTTAELARAYARAMTTVLAAEDEPFGLVLVESLAAGTPVVAARSGACPEIVGDDRIGRLFDGDDPDALAAAMAESMALAGDEDTHRACRERARDFDWSRVVELYEAAYSEATGRRPGGAGLSPRPVRTASRG